MANDIDDDLPGDRAQAVAAETAGRRLRFLHFWGHRVTPGEVGTSCLSQWYPAGAAKFGQNDGLAAFLAGTAGRVLVEASPRDRIWGIGLGASNPDAAFPSRWRGRNLFGFALMEVRARL